MMIQILLLMFTAFLLLHFLNNKNTPKVRAYKKIGIILFAVAMVIFVLYPEGMNKIASFMGVGRGADLLLYCLFVAFIYFSISIYLKFKDYESKINILSRKLAIMEANSQKESKGVTKKSSKE